MKADQLPVPMIWEVFGELAGEVFSTTLDFFSGCWKMRLSDFGEEKKTFVCKQGTFQFEVMLFWLTHAPSTFQREMGKTLQHFPFVKLYLDDVLTLSPALSEHVEHIWQVVSLVARHGLKIKVKNARL